MITYVNKKNAGQYQFLYELASKDLRTHDGDGYEVPFGSADALLPMEPITLDAETYMQDRYYVVDSVTGGYKLCADEEFDASKSYFKSDDITTLDEYFSFIEELNKINRNKYTRLPLDEEVFTINADTRMITVPPSFAANGVAVQGDEVAEVVYFKINRFFDVTDLDTKDIYIQWRSPAKDASGNFIEGVSAPWIKDIESEPGFIIFGWPLSSTITQAAGDVQFAVRFYEFNDKKQLVYSLSTLTQKVAVKPSLDFNLPDIILDNKDKIDDMTTLINDRFENSTLVSGSVEASDPRWTKTLTDTDKEIVNLDLDADGFRTKSITRSVQAVADDGGRISYGWRKFSIDNGAGMDMFSEITMAKTEDVTRQDGKLYYQRATGSTSLGDYVLYNGVLDKEADEYPVDGVFEKFSTGTIDGIGEYFVFATNRLRNSTKKVQSKTIIVPRPKLPVFEADTDNLPARGILEADAEYDLKLEVKPTMPDAGKFTYQWQKCAPGKDHTVEANWEDIDGANDKEYLIEGTSVETAEAGGEGDGFYRVIVTNNVNKESISLNSAKCRVTHHAATPKVTVVGDVSFTVDDMLIDGEKLEVTHSFNANCGETIQRLAEDSVTYQWFKYKANGRTVEDDIEASDKGLYERNVNDSLIEGETGTTYQPTSSGYYYCEVTNLYNGTRASKISRFFAVAEA
jgi:hypothetical protein